MTVDGLNFLLLVYRNSGVSRGAHKILRYLVPLLVRSGRRLKTDDEKVGKLRRVTEPLRLSEPVKDFSLNPDLC